MSVEALRTALAAEHAAIFGYGVVGAYLTGDTREAARQAEMMHRDRRDEAALRVQEGGGDVVAAEPAYELPFAVTDVRSAMSLAVSLEEGAAGAWRDALSGTTTRTSAAVSPMISAARQPIATTWPTSIARL